MLLLETLCQHLLDWGNFFDSVNPLQNVFLKVKLLIKTEKKIHGRLRWSVKSIGVRTCLVPSPALPLAEWALGDIPFSDDTSGSGLWGVTPMPAVMVSPSVPPSWSLGFFCSRCKNSSVIVYTSAIWIVVLTSTCRFPAVIRERKPAMRPLRVSCIGVHHPYRAEL